ncbi:hypothetical protein MTO96_038252 [Rhipicephalus appendiculatus]
MSRLFELVAFCGDLRAKAASEKGAAVALQGQLVETRREMAALQTRSLDAIPGFPAVPGCPGLAAADLAGCPGAPGAPPAAPGGPRSYAAALAGAGPSLAPSVFGLDVGDLSAQARVVFLQRSLLLHLSEDFRTTRTTALQVLMRAPRITLELDRINAEFRLLTLRRAARHGDVLMRPEEVMYPVDWLGVHPADWVSVPHSRLSARDAVLTARSGGLHIYTDGSYSEALAGAALSSRKNTDPRIAAIKRTLRHIDPASPVRFFHVPGHAGVFGNEVADYIASRATRHGQPTPHGAWPLPIVFPPIQHDPQLSVFLWEACDSVEHYLLDCENSSHLGEKLRPQASSDEIAIRASYNNHGPRPAYTAGEVRE